MSIFSMLISRRFAARAYRRQNADWLKMLYASFAAGNPNVSDFESKRDAYERRGRLVIIGFRSHSLGLRYRGRVVHRSKLRYNDDGTATTASGR